MGEWVGGWVGFAYLDAEDGLGVAVGEGEEVRAPDVVVAWLGGEGGWVGGWVEEREDRKVGGWLGRRKRDIL